MFLRKLSQCVTLAQNAGHSLVGRISKVPSCDFSTTNLMGVDSQQLYMEEEECVLVTPGDEKIGWSTKEFCHLKVNIEKEETLHRAFSLFLFNSENELLVQQRSRDKITFPLVWTNTVCSHPLHNLEEDDFEGVVDAMIRKTSHELSVDLREFGFDLYHPTKFLYRAIHDEKWGEHELDYCMIVRLKDGTEDEKLYDQLHCNSEEVEDVKWVSSSVLEEMMMREDLLFSPWFRLIQGNFLLEWWKDLQNDQVANLENDGKIHNFQED